jgi:hypothetical protein
LDQPRCRSEPAGACTASPTWCGKGFTPRRGHVAACDDLAVPPAVDPDPVRARRARIAKVVKAGKRVGYGLWLLAIAVFGVGAATRFRPAMVTIVVGCLALGSVLLAPSIVISYGIRAADREDRRG